MSRRSCVDGPEDSPERPESTHLRERVVPGRDRPRRPASRRLGSLAASPGSASTHGRSTLTTSHVPPLRHWLHSSLVGGSHSNVTHVRSHGDPGSTRFLLTFGYRAPSRVAPRRPTGPRRRAVAVSLPAASGCSATAMARSGAVAPADECLLGRLANASLGSAAFRLRLLREPAANTFAGPPPRPARHVPRASRRPPSSCTLRAKREDLG